MNRAFDWKFWAGLVISAAFLYLALARVDLPRLWEIIGSADPFLLLAAAVVVLIQYPLRAFRWGVLLAPLQATTFRNRLLATLVGFAANCVLPARLGEFIRANYLGASEELSGSSALGTVLVERLFDGLTLLAILAVGLYVTEFPAVYGYLATGLRAAGFALLSAYILLILLLVGFKWKAAACLTLIDRILFLLPKRFRTRVMEAVWKFSLGIVLLKGARGWFFAALYSCAVWLFAMIQIKVVAVSLGLDLPFEATFIVMAITSLGVMIPSSPGFIGTFHLAAQYSFLVNGFSAEEGLSAGILLHASFFLPTVLAGLGAFLSLHIPWKRLVSEEGPAE
ncbi:MAG: flippase-like domain-containing protein [Deltaproteobacteria bacterium]|nr:flippase-like domain-containing protein [Deltaproteobacteria bacterium]